ncbi:hypothetical protein [Celeribacter sp. PS-C1]|uniref:hypothetical protein n=1 Tax=Celeribacter sp. PS-C1 TaxID=2820813 RepID=UPI001CA5CB90|nr:hypothetical protein [Celeribacter sp. PS-C1]
MTIVQRTISTLTVSAFGVLLSFAASEARSQTPCEDALNKVWSVEDATSFEAIESQISVLKINAEGGTPMDFKNFPNEDGC